MPRSSAAEHAPEDASHRALVAAAARLLTAGDRADRATFLARALNGLADVRDRDLVYLKELQPKQTVQTDLEGFAASARDYDIRVENRKTGAGVRQTGDRPMSKLHLWSIRTTVCPEAFIDLRIEPGKESSWRIAYEFYQAPAPTRTATPESDRSGSRAARE